jgi:hypothetical protein
MIKRILEICSDTGGYVPVQLRLTPKVLGASGLASSRGIEITQASDDYEGLGLVEDQKIEVTWAQVEPLIEALRILQVWQPGEE